MMTFEYHQYDFTTHSVFDDFQCHQSIYIVYGGIDVPMSSTIILYTPKLIKPEYHQCLYITYNAFYNFEVA